MWSNWTECTKTCGTGVQTRNRTCTGPFNGGAECDGDADAKRDCNENLCPGTLHVLTIFRIICFDLYEASIL
jgi:hypothetical protein